MMNCPHCAAVLSAEQISLQYWASEFGIPLYEFRLGHIRTYESGRLSAVSREEVNAEVSVLLHLLESVGLGGEIRRRVECVGRIFATLFKTTQHLDILYLTDLQVPEITRVASPFYQASS